ncbi:MAG: aminoglycoside phosphotransferase family protein [bacterium]
MNKREIVEYLKSKSFVDPNVSKLGQGNNYVVYLVNEKFVLRLSRTDIVAENRLENEYIVLKFLEAEGVNFVQQPIFFDSEKSISLLTYLPGREVGLSDLSDQQLELFVSQILSLHSLKYEKYISFCKKNKFLVSAPETFLKHVEIRGVERFKYVEKNCLERDLVAWIKPKLKENVKIARRLSLRRGQIVLNHSDLAGSNMILNGDKLFFIDWERAKFMYQTDFTLSHMFIHGACSKSRQEKLISLFAKHSGQSESSLRKKVNEKMGIMKLNSVIWAVMMFTKMKAEGFKDWRKYRTMTDQRIKEYNELEPV